MAGRDEPPKTMVHSSSALINEGFRRSIGVPKGWDVIESRSRPGQFSFKNLHTGQIYAEFPMKQATMKRHRSLRAFIETHTPGTTVEEYKRQVSQETLALAEQTAAEPYDHLRRHGWLPYQIPPPRHSAAASPTLQAATTDE